MLDRYEGVIRNFFQTGEQSQIQALRTVEDFWRHSQFHLVHIFDKLVRRELVHIKTMSNYLVGKLTANDTTLERNSVYYKALKCCLTVVSLNRKKLEADNSEKLAPIIERHKTEFQDLMVGIVEVLRFYLEFIQVYPPNGRRSHERSGWGETLRPHHGLLGRLQRVSRQTGEADDLQASQRKDDFPVPTEY